MIMYPAPRIKSFFTFIVSMTKLREKLDQHCDSLLVHEIELKKASVFDVCANWLVHNRSKWWRSMMGDFYRCLTGKDTIGFLTSSIEILKVVQMRFDVANHVTKQSAISNG